MSSVYMPDGREVSYWRDATVEDRQLLADLDRRALRLGLPKRERPDIEWHTRVSWPYGPNVNVGQRIALLDWAEAEHLRPARARDMFHYPCLDWLRTGRCSGARCDRTHLSSWQDHRTGWERLDGTRLYVAQPYGLSDAERCKLAALDAEPGLRVQIAATGWYGFGTHFIGIWANETVPVSAEDEAALRAGVLAMFKEAGR